jgi:hypothetical protein
MKKKILILSLISVFFVSTTSLPVTVHLCRMAQTTKTCKCGKMGHCMMNCKIHPDKFSNQVTVKNNCCTTKTIDTSVRSEYLSQKDDNNSNAKTFVVILTSSPDESSEHFLSDKKYFQDFSPPLYLSNNLYLNNSVLLI